MRKIVATIIFIFLFISLAGCEKEPAVETFYKLEDIKISVSDSFDVPAGVFPITYTIDNEGRLKTEIGLSVQLSIKDQEENDVPLTGNSIIIEQGKTYTVSVTAVTTLGNKTVVYTIRAIDSAGNQDQDAIKSISIQSGTLKTDFSLNEQLSLKDVILQVVYESGKRSEFEVKSEWVTNFSTVSVGTRIMGITYGGKSCSFTYTVRNEYISAGLSYRFISATDSFEIVSGVPDANGSITIPKKFDGKPITSIAEKAFENSQQLFAVVFSAPCNIETIGARAFANCINLPDISLPVSVTKLEEGAFFGCNRLIDASLGSIDELPRNAFADCIALNSIFIPKSVITIGVGAFADCVSLEKVVSEAQSNLVSIKSQAFSTASALKILMFTATIPPQTEGVALPSNAEVKILVPDDNVDEYKTQWSDYSAKIRTSTVEVIFYADGEEYHRGATVFGSDLTDVPQLPEKTGYTANWSRENFSKISKLNDRIDAVFFPIDITVIFRTENEDIVRYLKFGAALADIPTVPPKDGFQGLWNRNNFDSIAQIDLIVLPIYTPLAYTIKFITSGGDTVADLVADFGSEISLPVGIKAGNSFHGWYTSQTLNEQFSLTTMPAGNMTLWAKFLPKNYNLIFNTSGGLKLAGLLQQYDTLIKAVPSKEGHTFLNWYDNADCEGEAVTRVPAQDITLYAKWQLTDYSIAFVANEGDDVASLTYAFGDELPPLPESARTGYDFVGWYQDYYLQTPFSYEQMPSRSLMLYAKWRRKQYLVSFITDGVTLATQQVLFNDFIGYKPERAGYLIDGYFLDEAKTNAYTLGRMPSSDLAIYVEWRPITYSIQYILSGGANGANNPSSYDLELLKQGDINFAPPEREGYSFSYWYIFTDNRETQISKLTTGDMGNKTIYAKWQINSYTLTFVTYSETVEPITALYNQPFNTAISRSGYKFLGWYFDAEYTQKLMKNVIPALDATLYAKWQTISYAITYTNGYTHPNKTSYTVEDEDFTLLDADRAGYSFVEWRSEGAPITELVIDRQNPADISLSAWWQINRYTIIFDTVGGTALASIDNAEYYSLIPEEQRTTAREHYIFSGWYDESYQQQYPLIRVPSQNITLFAKWTPIQYRIVYNLDGVANNALNVPTYTVEEDITLYPISKYGYLFLGWYDNRDFSGEPLTNLAVGTGEYLQLYPKWQPIESTISFEPNGASAVPSVTQAYDTLLSAPQAPTYEGYRLEGWYADEQLSELFVFDKMPAEDITLYAKWSVVVYTITYISDIFFDNYNRKTYTIESGEYLLLPIMLNGYAFIKWYLDGDSEKTPYTSIPSGSVGDLTLRAEFTPIETQVTLDADAGYIGDAHFVTLAIIFGDSDFEFPVATLAARVFLGWADSGGIRYADENGNAVRSWNKTENVTLTPIWAAQYNINSSGVIIGLSGGVSPENLIIPSNIEGVAVTAIGDNAFTNNAVIKYVELSSGVKTIGNNAFYNCAALESVVLPESIKAIGNNVFANCIKLTSINLPPKGSDIGTTILRGCGALTQLKFSGETTLQKLFGNSSFANTYEVTIDDAKYYIPNSLSTITVSNALRVADYALFGAASVNNIILQYIVEIGARAFSGCLSAETIYLPSMLQLIDVEAFDGCVNAEYVYSSLNALVEIRERAFRNNQMLDYFYADNTASILDGAFNGCSSLKGVTFHGANTLGKIFGAAAYEGSYAAQQSGATYHIPSSLISVKLSSKASMLWKDAFKDINIFEINNTSMLTQICKDAFRNSGITDFVVGDKVVKIEEGAFAFCQNLTSFSFNNNALSTQDSSIGQAILEGTALQSLCINGKIVTPKLFGSNGGDYEDYTVSIDNQLYHIPLSLVDMSILPTQEIAAKAFFGMKTLFGITIPSTVINIRESAFADCINLSTITIPEGVTDIGNSVLSGCGQLTSIFLPSTVSAIGQNIFDGCSSLYYVNIDLENPYYETIGNVLYTKDGKKLIFYPRTKTDNYYEVKSGVQEIYPAVFAENIYLTAISLPSTLSIVGAKAFYNNTQSQLIFGGFENLQYIGEKAFYNCINGIERYDLPMPNLTYIGGSAFENCGFVGAVTCADVGFIGESAFKNSSIISFVAQSINIIAPSAFKTCLSLTTFTVDTLESVAELAFEGCAVVEEFTLPDDKTISYYFGFIPSLTKMTFSGSISAITADLGECLTLSDIFIPRATTYLAANSFSGFFNLLSFDIDENNTSLAIENNAVVKDGNILLYYLPYANAVEYTVQAGIYKINNLAFANHKYLNKITLSSSVDEIGTEIFYNTEIKDLTLLCDVPNRALGYLDALERMTYNGGRELGKLFSNISNGVTAVQKGVAYVIPKNLTEVGFTSSPAPNALEDCKNITKVVLSSLDTVHQDAFNGCVSLVDINLEYVTVLYDRAFYNCQLLADISLPSRLVAVGVQVFDNTDWLANQSDGLVYLRNFVYCYKNQMPKDYSLEFLHGTTDAVKGIFIGMNNLYSVSFPSTVDDLSSFVFSDCTSLRLVNFDGLGENTGLPPYMFSGCSQLNDIVLESEIKSIGEYAFFGCHNITRIVLPSALARIGDYAFSGTSITSIIMPNSADNIGENIFYGCDLLENITLGTNFPGMLNGVKNVRTLTYNGNTPTMKLFGNQRDDKWLYPVRYEGQDYYVSSFLNSINIKGITKIQPFTFFGLSSVIDISIPEGIRSIGNYAFQNSGLQQISLPQSLEVAGLYMFTGCNNLEIITMQSLVEDALSAPYLKELHYYGDSMLLKLFSKYQYDNTYIASYGGRNYYVPSSFERAVFKGEFIGDNAIQGINSLNYIEAGTSVKEIGAYAFANYGNLFDIVDEQNLISIGQGAFENCSWYENYILYQYGIVQLGKVVYGFVGEMTEHYEMIVPEGVLDITDGAFAGYDNLATVSLPSTLLALGTGIFKDCVSLVSAQLPATLVSIGEEAFSGCSMLATIIFPESLTILGRRAFARCNFSEITLSDKLVDIDIAPFEKAMIATLILEKEYKGIIEECFVSKIIMPGNNSAHYLFTAKPFDDSYKITGINGGTAEYYIPQTLSEIELTGDSTMVAYAFYGFKLRKVTLGSVTSIQAYAFAECIELEEINVPIGLRTIGQYAFYRCSVLDINGFSGHSLTAIGKNAFEDCDAVEEFALSDSLIEIGEELFKNCDNLTKLTVFKDAFRALSGARISNLAVYNNINIRNLFDVDDMPYLKNVETMSTIPIPEGYFSGLQHVQEIKICDAVTAIGSDIFEGCDSLSRIFIPYIGANLSAPDVLDYLLVAPLPLLREITVTKQQSIAQNAFANSLLTKVTYMYSVMDIGDGAFENCADLTTLEMSSSDISFGQSAFENCAQLVEIGSHTATRIGARAFYNCALFAGAGLSNTSSVGTMAFFGAESLVTAGIDHTTTQIDEAAFKGCILFNQSTFAGLNILGVSAFEDCVNLTVVDFSGNTLLQEISSKAFNGCLGIINVDFSGSNIKTIGNSAFSYTALESLILPHSIGSIGESAFSNCQNLLSADLGNGIGSIGVYAFSDTPLESIVIPSSNISYGKGCFARTLLSSYSIVSSSVPKEMFIGCTALSEVTLAEGISSIGDRAFCDTSIITIELPSTVKSIGEGVFYGCLMLASIQVHPDNKNFISKSGVLFDYLESEYIEYDDKGNVISRTDTTSIIKLICYPAAKTDENYDMPINHLADSSQLLSRIEPYAFSNNIYVTNIVFPSGITTIGYNAFENCSSLKNLALSGTQITLIDKESFKGCEAVEIVSLPSSLEAIGEAAFQECILLTNITIHSAVMTVGRYAFSATGLKSVTFNQGSQQLSIEDGAFKNCEDLASVSLPSNLSAIGEGAFQNCQSLTTITIPEEVMDIGAFAFSNSGLLTFVFSADSKITNIGNGVFKDCTQLSNINLHVAQNLYAIGESTFENCSSLLSISIPTKITIVDAFAFKGCTNLQSITINCEMLAIADGAFQDCVNLQNLSISGIISEIGQHVFVGCSSLVSLTFDTNYFNLPPDLFTDVPSLEIIYVVTGNLEDYKTNFPEYADKFFGI